MFKVDELNGKTKDQLKVIAATFDIKRLSAMKKMDIINAILEAEKAAEKNKAAADEKAEVMTTEKEKSTDDTESRYRIIVL